MLGPETQAAKESFARGIPYQEKKVWGQVSHIFASPHAAVSILDVEAGFCCSTHKHIYRLNMFVVMSGEVAIKWKGGESPLERKWNSIVLSSGDDFTVQIGIWHRFEVLASGKIVEVYWPGKEGDVVSLDDIIRADVGGPV